MSTSFEELSNAYARAPGADCAVVTPSAKILLVRLRPRRAGRRSPRPLRSTIGLRRCKASLDTEAMPQQSPAPLASAHPQQTQMDPHRARDRQPVPVSWHDHSATTAKKFPQVTQELSWSRRRQRSVSKPCLLLVGGTLLGPPKILDRKHRLR